MYYCSDFVSRPVLSLYEGELIGSVDKLLFDKKLKKLLFLELMRNKIIKKLVFMMLRTFKRKLTSNACR